MAGLGPEGTAADPSAVEQHGLLVLLQPTIIQYMLVTVESMQVRAICYSKSALVHWLPSCHDGGGVQ
jgi:hypothetical protein